MTTKAIKKLLDELRVCDVFTRFDGVLEELHAAIDALVAEQVRLQDCLANRTCQRDELLAERDALKADAARYQHYRKRQMDSFPMVYATTALFDKAIDAAMQGEKE